MNLSWPTAHPHVLACVVGLAASLASLVSVGRAAYAEDKPDKLPLELLAEASACYEVLDYACVTDLLALLPVWYQPSRVGAVPDGVALDQVPELLEAGRILAVSHLALRQNRAARRVFRWQLMLDPEYVLEGDEVPPRFFRVFFEVHAQESAQPVSQRAVVQALGMTSSMSVVGRAGLVALEIVELERRLALPPPPLKLDVGLRVGLGWVALTGQDSEVYDSAAGLTVGLDVILGDTGWVVGLESGGSLHTIALDDLLLPQGQDRPDLNTFFATVYAGREWRLAWLGLRPGVALGVGGFGLDAFFDRTGASFDARLAALAYSRSALYFSVQGLVRSTSILDEGLRTSLTFDASLAVGTMF